MENEPKQERSLESVTNEYGNACASLGEKEFFLKRLPELIKELHSKLSTLDEELIRLRAKKKEIK